MTKESDDLSYLESMNDGDEVEEPIEEVVEEPAEEPIEEPSEEVDEEPSEEVTKAEDGGENEIATAKSRKEARLQKLANERNTEREARIRAEAERDALLKFKSATPAPDNSEALRARNEKLALMDPQERALFLQNESIDQMKQHLLLSELRAEDRADKAIFESKAVVDPRYSRHKAEVESELVALRSKGINATREQVLAQIIGRKLLSEKPRKDVRKDAAKRVASAKGQPIGARSGSVASAGKGDSLSDIEARLKGKSFNQMFN